MLELTYKNRHTEFLTLASNRFDSVTRGVKTTTATTHAAGATVIGVNNARLDMQIAPEVIVDADVSPTAAIQQSKLSLTNATANTSGAAVKGIAKFDSANFEDDGAGFISIKASGVAVTEIANIGNGVPLWILSILYFALQIARLTTYQTANSLVVLISVMMGVVYVLLLKKGIDLGKWMHNLLHWLNKSIAPKTND